jgi:3-oxoacyl-[acyl-carrier-protein] synthase III
MSQTVRSRIASFGAAYPDKVLTNHDLEKIVDTSDQWISERTGIRERRVLSEGENNSDIAAKACLQAIERAGIKAEDVDLILGCTTTPDRWMPSLASTVQAKIGATRCAAAYDVLSACAGWMTGLQIADSFVRTGQYKNVLVIGSEALSRFLNWKDRTTCVLFGDAAAATLIQPCQPGDPGEILDVRVRADGRYGDHLDIPGGGSQLPPSAETVSAGQQYIRMNGQEIYKHAVKSMASICEEVLAGQGKTINDVTWFVPHQANIRIIETVGKKLNIPLERVALNVHKYGNTSAATVPTCFEEYVMNGKIKRGDLVLMTTFGGGLSWAGGLVRW